MSCFIWPTFFWLQGNDCLCWFCVCLWCVDTLSVVSVDYFTGPTLLSFENGIASPTLELSSRFFRHSYSRCIHVVSRIRSFLNVLLWVLSGFSMRSVVMIWYPCNIYWTAPKPYMALNCPIRNHIFSLSSFLCSVQLCTVSRPRLPSQSVVLY